MFDLNGGYPTGAAHDSSAPYNEKDLPEKQFDVSVTVTLYRETEVTTDLYTGIEYDAPDSEFIDTSGMGYEEWDTAYHDNYPYDIDELLRILVDVAKEKMQATDDKKQKRHWRHVIDCASGWECVDMEIREE